MPAPVPLLSKPQEFSGFWRPKPGSILADGSLVDYAGHRRFNGPCFVPYTVGYEPDANYNRQHARRERYAAAGWTYACATRWPSVLPNSRVICVERNAVPKA